MKKFAAIIILLHFIYSLVSSQDPDITKETRVYKIFDNASLKVMIFYPEGMIKAEPRPSIAFFHGGGWAYGDPAEFEGACNWFAERGFVTLTFQYRLAIRENGSIPNPDITPVECVKDARSAIRWMRINVNDLGIDPERIIVSGQSAGGQLALSTALCDSVNDGNDNLDISPVPDALLLFSSNVNTVEAWLDYLMGERRNEIWSISPYHNLKSGMPPAIEFHGIEDCMVPVYSIEFFRDKTRQLGNHFELVFLEGRGHYLGEGIQEYSDYFDEEILERSYKFIKDIGMLP